MAKFIVSDGFGQTVIATYASWDHVTQHTEMIGKEEAVKGAIETPEVVYEGRTPGSITVAVVRYRKGVGYLNTAYLTTLAPKGKVLWQRS